MAQPVVIVTGANGQLGKALQAASLARPRPWFHFIFLTKDDLAIDQPEAVRQCFEKLVPSFCINCAAYTAVDKAETERDLAMQVNATGTGLLAAACKSFNTRFIHISTDYVFAGTATEPYKETDSTSPVNYYGLTKLKGEQLAMKNNDASIIIRTAWVYSEYGNNFVKTMIRLMKERESLGVVDDQFGSPTYAADLAKLILAIIEASVKSSAAWVPGIYHYSNEGIISWYDFAAAIKTFTGSNCTIRPIPTAAYPTPAKRPAYSAFDKSKIKATWNLEINDWKRSLETVMSHLGF